MQLPLLFQANCFEVLLDRVSTRVEVGIRALPNLLLLILVRLELDALLQQVGSAQEWVTQFHSAILQVEIVYTQVDRFEWTVLAQNLEYAEAVVNDEHGNKLIPGLNRANTQ